METAYDPHAPATKKDILEALEIMMGAIGRLENRMDGFEGRMDSFEGRMDDMEERMATKDDLIRSEQRILAVLELQRRDIFDVQDLKIARVETQITEIKRHLRLAP
jgi:hypothetical protein